MTKTEIFIERAINKHGNRFNYSNVEYIKSTLKVKIICEEHGEFEQEANSHLMGIGCARCSGISKCTTEEFIEKANEIHKFRYNYHKTKYINNKTKIDIECYEHGMFKQTPHSHLRGSGCGKCVGKEKSNTDDFIEKSIKIHNNTYDYYLVNYIDCESKVIIICRKHGEFEQMPHSHLAGKGCRVCKNSKGERSIIKFLDKYEIEYINEKKFDNCRNILPLPFDFYLPIYNLCIEFDGRQHYISNDFFGGEDRLNKTKINDGIKDKYCLDNNIELLRIPYYEYNNVDDILKDKLNI